MEIKKFNEFVDSKLNENTELINQILDKISTSGIDSLTEYEKSVLDSASAGKVEHNTMEEDINSFLDDKFGNLSIQNYKKKSFNFHIVGYYFIDEETNLLLDLSLFKILDEQTNRGRVLNTLYVDYKNLNEIKDKYSLSNSDLDEYIKNWFMNSKYISELKYNEELPLPDNFSIKEVSLVFGEI
jgi:hypothetical protein